MHLYYMFSESSEWSNLDEAMLAYVSEERRQKVMAYRFIRDRKLSLYAGILLPYACADQFDLPYKEVDPIWPGKQKPYLHSHPDIHFSIAHSGSCVAVAVSDKEIGLDLELIKKAPMKILKRAFSPFEAERITGSSDPNLEFYRIWTRKESYGKFLGTGLSNHVLKANTFTQEHSRCISSGILTADAAYSEAQFREHLDSLGLPSSDLASPALYYSVYGKEEAPEITPVTLKELLEFYLLWV